MKSLRYFSLFAVLIIFGLPVWAEGNRCVDCHEDINQQYENSIHGRARLKSGLNVAPTCTNCHSLRTPGPHTDQHIKNKTKIPGICGSCHSGILREYKYSIHGVELLKKNNTDAPSCTDCHGVHVIAEALKPEAQVSVKNIPQTCGRCHAEKILMQKYGIKTDLISTYKETFHGKANLYGQLTTANCSSCHGIHNILKIDDPNSQVSQINLPKTCGKCHAAAINKPNFGNTVMHVKPSRKEEPIVFYIRVFYMIMIVGTIGGMLVYNLFDLNKRLQERRK